MNDPVLKISVCDRRTNSRYKNLERNRKLKQRRWLLRHL